MIDTILIICAVWFIAVFGLSRFFVPHLGFKKENLPDDLPRTMEQEIGRLKSQADSPGDFLKLAYGYLGAKYRSERFNTLLKLNYAFKSLPEIWILSGYIPCTQSNFLMRIFLTRSGFFRDEEIKVRHTFVNFFIHQYLQVRLDDKWLDVDVGEKQKGMEAGKHLKYFG